MNKEFLYYLASPYSHKDPAVVEKRYDQVLELAATLINEGYTLIEPIVMGHEKANRFKMPTDFDFWQTHNKRMIAHCDGLVVAMMDGWDESHGVRCEIEYATSLGLPIHYLEWYSTIKPVTPENGFLVKTSHYPKPQPRPTLGFEEEC